MQTRVSPGAKPRPPRRKACASCVKSKARCSLEKPACSRCRLRDQNCVYETAPLASEQRSSRLAQGGAGAEPRGLSRLSPVLLPDSNSASITSQTPVSLADAVANPPSWTPVDNTIWHPPNQHLQGQFLKGPLGTTELHFRNIQLTPTSEANSIRSRWLKPYFIPTLSLTDIPKVVLPYTVQFIKRIFRTYPRRMLKDGDIPPIIHQAQVKGSEIPRALANCYSIVRMWEHAVPGSEEVVLSTLRREMDRLSSEVYAPLFPSPSVTVLANMTKEPRSTRLPAPGGLSSVPYLFDPTVPFSARRLFGKHHDNSNGSGLPHEPKWPLLYRRARTD
jgi:hypothetical protein